MEPTGRGLLDHLKSLSFIMVFSGCLSILSAGEIPRNILWDGGLETGFGNSFWTTIVANSGPSYRNMWSNGVVRLRLPIGTRVYYLEQGRYTIAAWVKRAPGFEDDENLSITFRVRNKNYYTDKEDDRNQHAFSFQVPSGDEWHRISRTFDIATLIRHYFHVEVSPGGKGEGILVDAVSLTPGETAPEKMRPAADVEAGFWIPEETGIYNDGDERIVELIIHNYTLERKAKVFVEIYDHREDRIKERTFKVKLPAHDGVRVKVPLDDLPLADIGWLAR